MRNEQFEIARQAMNVCQQEVLINITRNIRDKIAENSDRLKLFINGKTFLFNNPQESRQPMQWKTHSQGMFIKCFSSTFGQNINSAQHAQTTSGKGWTYCADATIDSQLLAKDAPTVERY